jgi:hypothetical protein
MAEDLVVVNSTGNEMLELAICQPEHPNQAVFLQTFDISLEDFRSKIAESELVLPEEWAFMTRAGSLVSTDQEENLQLSSIVRQREDMTVYDVMIAPSLTYQPPPPRRPMGPRQGRSTLELLTEIIAALRDVYVTSIQPNLHEFIKPLMIAAFLAAALAFVLSGILFVVSIMMHYWFSWLLIYFMLILFIIQFIFQ